MLRGSIDNVSNNRVDGWIFSEAKSVRDSTVLAFIGDNCVGSAKVERYRKDLADAGLGDGYLGFHIPIAVTGPEELASIVVKLEGSDAIIVQRDAQVVSRAARRPLTRGRTLSSLRWMLNRGWLTQSEFDVLRYLEQFGVYERILLEKTDSVEDKRIDPSAAAKDLLDLHYGDDLSILSRRIQALSDLSEIDPSELVPNNHFAPIVGIWSRTELKLDVLEGSHQRQEESSGDLTGAVEYRLDANRLLFLNLNCLLAAKSVTSPDGIHVLYAKVVV